MVLVAFVAAAMLWSPAIAQADERAEVQTELDAKASSLTELADQVKSSGDEVAKLEDQISDLLGDISDQQAKRGKLQKRISALSKAMYKNGDQLNLLTIITNSESLGDVLDQIEVRRKVLSEYLDLSAEQERVTAELEVSYKQVSAQKDEQAAKLEQLRSKQEELTGAVAALQNRIDELDAQERAALEAAAEAERQAAAAAVAAGQPAVAVSAPREDAGKAENTGKSDESADQGEAAAQSDSEPAAAETAETGWQSGVASAYGGSTDDSATVDDPTATGDICDDYSMGVAVPMAWGPEEYYGRSVEITYNGTTVVATVNDCGGMGDGARSLDLQPGVFKALGFDSCDDWGVREVSYRFL